MPCLVTVIINNDICKCVENNCQTLFVTAYEGDNDMARFQRISAQLKNTNKSDFTSNGWATILFGSTAGNKIGGLKGLAHNRN